VSEERFRGDDGAVLRTLLGERLLLRDLDRGLMVRISPGSRSLGPGDKRGDLGQGIFTDLRLLSSGDDGDLVGLRCLPLSRGDLERGIFTVL